MDTKQEMYEYIDQKKKKVMKKYDQLLEQIERSDHIENLITIMSCQDFLIRNEGYRLLELSNLFAHFLDEYVKDKELFCDCKQQISQHHITYVSKDEKYSIQFSIPPGSPQDIIVRYHGHIVPYLNQPYYETAVCIRDTLKKFQDNKRISDFFKVVELVYCKNIQTKNPLILFMRCIKTIKYIRKGLKDEMNKKISEYEKEKERYERENEIFDRDQEEAQILKQKADHSLQFFKAIGWEVRYKGILLEDGTMCF